MKFEIIEKGYKKFFFNNKNVILYTKDYKTWLHIKGTKLYILPKGIVFNKRIKFWNDMNKEYINLLCSKIEYPKINELKLFLFFIINDSNKIHNEEEAYKLLKKCEMEISIINEKLDFFKTIYEKNSLLRDSFHKNILEN